MKNQIAMPVKEQQEIVIERREIVAKIPLGNGSTSPLDVAYRAIAEYIGENDGPGGFTITFDLWGRTFGAFLQPRKEVNIDGRDEY